MGCFDIQYLHIIISFDTDINSISMFNGAFEKLLGKWRKKVVLDQTIKRACSILRIVAIISQPYFGVIMQ